MRRLGQQARLGDETWEEPILAQVAGIALDDDDDRRRRRGPRVGHRDRSRSTGPGSTGRCASSRSSTPPAVSGTRVYLDRLKALREAKDERSRHARAAVFRRERAIELAAGLSATWSEADVPEEKAELLHAIYERITVAGRRSWGSG